MLTKKYHIMKTLQNHFFLKFIITPCLLLIFSISSLAQIPFENEYAFGLDLSFLKSHEDNNDKYYDIDGVQKPALEIFRQYGYNWGRVMICNEPTDRLPQTLDYVIASAQQLKNNGYKFLLDYMFSNGWANPMTQPTPAAWVELSHSDRVEAVYQYIRHTMKSLKEADVMPDIVQIGNEIGNGFLWPDGRIYYDNTGVSQWKNVADYLSAGIRAIREVAGKEHKVKIMLHVDHGGDIPMTQTFFDNMKEYKVEYDVIGFSFYPWSHGTLLDLRDNLNFTALCYNKEIILIQTGYYWQPSRYFRDGQMPPFPETPEGQRQWLEAVNELVLATPNGLGKGIFWWEPMMGRRGYFDENGKVQPIIQALKKYSLPIKRADGQTRIQ